MGGGGRAGRRGSLHHVQAGRANERYMLQMSGRKYLADVAFAVSNYSTATAAHGVQVYWEARATRFYCTRGRGGRVAARGTRKSEGAMTTLLTRLFLLACLLANPAALGQTYPDHNVTIVVTSAAGALTDVLTRAVAQRLSEIWKQSVIVENRGGAGYSIAAQSVMRAEHDGYTLLASETGFYTTQPHLYAKDKLAYDAEKDFVPVAGYGTIPTALLVNPSVPVNSVSDLIALAKTKPGAVTFGTAGIGTALHIAGLELENL